MEMSKLFLLRIHYKKEFLKMVPRVQFDWTKATDLCNLQQISRKRGMEFLDRPLLGIRTKYSTIDWTYRFFTDYLQTG
jgi:hypothetical protein